MRTGDELELDAASQIQIFLRRLQWRLPPVVYRFLALYPLSHLARTQIPSTFHATGLSEERTYYTFLDSFFLSQLRKKFIIFRLSGSRLLKYCNL